MPKSKNRKIARNIKHFKTSETRDWKRTWNATLLFVLSVCCLISAGIAYITGGGGVFQTLIVVLSILLAASLAGLVPLLYKRSQLKRWQILLIKTGFLCATGMAVMLATVQAG